jgi:hypothetical protein
MEINKATNSVQPEKVDVSVKERELRSLGEYVEGAAEEVFSHSWVPGQVGGMGRHTVNAHFENSATKKISKRGLELGIHKTKIETAPESPKHKKH